MILNFRPLPADRKKRFVGDVSSPKIKDYRIIKELGRGGMGIVFLAISPGLQRPVALKVINPSRVTAQTVERFESEIGNLIKINGTPGIVGIHDRGQYADDDNKHLPFYVMDLVPHAVAVTKHLELNAASLPNRMKTVETILEALAAAHRVAVPHLDIAAGNVLVRESWEIAVGEILNPISLVDFLISKKHPNASHLWNLLPPEAKDEIRLRSGSRDWMDAERTLFSHLNQLLRGETLYDAQTARELQIAPELYAASLALSTLKGNRLLLEGLLAAFLAPINNSLTPKVVDFGLALDVTKEESHELLHGLGRMRYMPPERLRNEKFDAFRCDVFSLGVLSYEVLTGRHPFQTVVSPAELPGFSATLASREASMSLIPLRQVDARIPAKVAAVIEHALADSPTRRFASATEFLSNFKKALRGDLLDFEPATFINRSRAFCNLYRGQVWAGSLICLSLLIGTGVSLWQARKALIEKRLAEASERREKIARASTDHAMQFMEAVLFSPDTYNVGNQTLNLDFLLHSVDREVSILKDDKRAKAIALGALGRVASNWGKQDVGARWLQESADLWKSLTSTVDSLDENERKAALSTVLNYLAWALVGNPDIRDGRGERAKRASQPAHEAYVLSAELMGATSEDTLVFRADWLRFSQWSGDPGALKGWIEFLATAAGVSEKEVVSQFVNASRDTADRVRAGDGPGAKKRVRDLIRPLLSEKRPRLRARMPWGLAQASENLREAIKILPLLPMVLPQYPEVRDIRTEDLKLVEPVMLSVAVDLEDEILPSNHLDRQKIKDLVTAREK